MKLPLLLMAVGLSAGCSSLRKADYAAEDIPKFTSTVTAASEVVVYEGLPSPRDAELYAQETRRPDVIWIDGFPFYARPITVSPPEKARLIRLAMRKEEHAAMLTFADSPLPPDTVRLGKFCGGFHPDFAVIWSRGSNKSETLICFGCREWQNFTAHGRLYSDLSAHAYQELNSVLSKYATPRPPPKTG